MTHTKGRPKTKWNDRVPSPRMPLSRDAKEAGWEIVKCITCRGTGTYHGHECGLCEGFGKITVHK